MQDNITLDNIHSYCRTCLNELPQPPTYNVQKMHIQIQYWLQVPLIKDSCPMFVCQQCHEKLECFLEFHQMYSRSRKVLQDILEKSRHIRKRNTGSTSLKTVEISVMKADEYRHAVSEDGDGPESETEIFEYILEEEEPADMQPSSGDGEPTRADDYLQDNEQSIDNNITSNDSTRIEEIEGEIEKSDDCISSEELDNAIEQTSDSAEVKQLKNVKSCPTRSLNKYVKKFPCDQCEKVCLSQETLDGHKRAHQGLTPYPCPKCDRSFNAFNRLKKHLEEIHAKLSIICEFEGCGKEFRRSETYRLHFRRHTEDPEKQPKHICEECGKVYPSSIRLKYHQYSHKPKTEYPFQCNECSHAFIDRRGLREHKLRHAGIKNYECPLCGVKKTTKYELKMHINSHTKERQWQCPKCPMIFHLPKNLRNHDKIVHQGIRRYMCSYCDLAFGAHNSLKNHEMRHTGLKPHVCSECGQCFRQMCALKTHLRRRHKLDPQKTATSVVTQGVTT